MPRRTLLVVLAGLAVVTKSSTLRVTKSVISGKKLADPDDSFEGRARTCVKTPV
jgi:hypothetical protein